jgi:hypothetical protein
MLQLTRADPKHHADERPIIQRYFACSSLRRDNSVTEPWRKLRAEQKLGVRSRSSAPRQARFGAWPALCG